MKGTFKLILIFYYLLPATRYNKKIKQVLEKEKHFWKVRRKQRVSEQLT